MLNSVAAHTVPSLSSSTSSVLLIILLSAVRCMRCDTATAEPMSCANESLDCKWLQPGQYYCADPVIDLDTQREQGCSQSKSTVEVDCFPVNGICCNGRYHNGQTAGFKREIPCKHANEKKFSVALLLSIFLGWLGIDRFYLGYPALGMLKFCTFGFMLIWTLVDIVLIAMQIIGPADGSAYIIDYYGPALIRISSDNMTYILPPGRT